MSKKILLLSPVFNPNIGGVETHLNDLVYGLSKRDYEVYVETFSPITTKAIQWRRKEKIYGTVNIRRHWWFGTNIFHFVEGYPLLDFLYISPYLMLIFLRFLLRHRDVRTVHAHGMNAALVSIIGAKLFKLKVIVSTHAIYERDKSSLTALLVGAILKRAAYVLALSKASKDEVISFGVPERKVHIYRYWVDTDLFKPTQNRREMREQYGFEDNFTVLFIGRLIEKKGVSVFVDIAKTLKKINFVIIGNGPLEGYVRDNDKDIDNLCYLGKKSNEEIANYMNCADLLCIPSQYEEGFGRVVMEAVACGIPVVGSNKGAIPEAVDINVSMLSNPTLEGISKSIMTLYDHPEVYERYRSNCRQYAINNFSSNNILGIIDYY